MERTNRQGQSDRCGNGAANERDVLIDIQSAIEKARLDRDYKIRKLKDLEWPHCYLDLKSTIEATARIDLAVFANVSNEMVIAISCKTSLRERHPIVFVESIITKKHNPCVKFVFQMTSEKRDSDERSIRKKVDYYKNLYGASMDLVYSSKVIQQSQQAIKTIIQWLTDDRLQRSQWK